MGPCPPTTGRVKRDQFMIDVILVLVLLIGLSVALYPQLRGWRKKRRAAWELDRAEWRRWLTRP